MVAKASTKSRLERDEISEVLGSVIYAQNAYFKELRDRCLTSFSRDLIPVSRHYMMLSPQVVVDFEPSPNMAKFWVEEKRKFFMEKGIVYVPVFLGQFLSPEQFSVLYHKEKEILARGYREALEDEALLKPLDKDPIWNDPVILSWIDQEATRRCAEKRLRGVAKNKHLPHVKAEIISELKRMAKNGGDVGSFCRGGDSPLVAR